MEIMVLRRSSISLHIILILIISVHAQMQYLHYDCYGSGYMDAMCNGSSVIFPLTVTVGTKPKNLGCPIEYTTDLNLTEANHTNCCRPNVNDQCTGIYETVDGQSAFVSYLYHEACVGLGTCSVRQVARTDTLYLGCNNTIFYYQTTFMAMTYQCIDETTISRITSSANKVTDGSSASTLHLMGQTYPFGINKGSSGSCSVETSNCSAPINIKLRDIRLESVNGSCRQSLQVSDGPNYNSVTLDCNNNNNFTMTNFYTSTTNYFTIELNNILDSNGGFFWVEFGTIDGVTVQLQCPAQSPRYNCSSEPTTTEETTTEITTTEETTTEITTEETTTEITTTEETTTEITTTEITTTEITTTDETTTDITTTDETTIERTNDSVNTFIGESTQPGGNDSLNIVLIVLGCCAAIVIVIVIVYCRLKKKKCGDEETGKRSETNSIINPRKDKMSTEPIVLSTAKIEVLPSLNQEEYAALNGEQGKSKAHKTKKKRRHRKDESNCMNGTISSGTIQTEPGLKQEIIENEGTQERKLIAAEQNGVPSDNTEKVAKSRKKKRKKHINAIVDLETGVKPQQDTDQLNQDGDKEGRKWTAVDQNCMNTEIYSDTLEKKRKKRKNKKKIKHHNDEHEKADDRNNETDENVDEHKRLWTVAEDHDHYVDVSPVIIQKKLKKKTRSGQQIESEVIEGFQWDRNNDISEDEQERKSAQETNAEVSPDVLVKIKVTAGDNIDTQNQSYIDEKEHRHKPKKKKKDKKRRSKRVDGEVTKTNDANTPFIKPNVVYPVENLDTQ